MEALTFEEKAAVCGIYPDFRSERRTDVIESVQRWRSWLEPENVKRKQYDSALEKLKRMTDEEFDGLDLFYGLASAVTLDDLFKSMELLRCPRCGGILEFCVANKSRYLLSADGSKLVCDFSYYPSGDVKETLRCPRCDLNCRWKRDMENGIVLLEGKEQWN